MPRYITIHGHFYQPPRENPWLEAIERQESAYPYHDWNERVNAECYAPNAASRILDSEGRIVQIVNNYERISFNFGPTLLSWLEEQDAETYEAVLHADRESRVRFGGHGSALAQVYNHMILPLETPRDRQTQVVWGIRDFEHRFGRRPEGMWLPETAVDLETLAVLARNGIQFTVLAPHQAARVRRLGEQDWQDVQGGRVDPSMPYRVELPSGESIAVFFYDGPVSRAVAFEGLLTRGESLAGRLLSAFPHQDDRPQLVHIATDGETYGHHHRYGDMALAFALDLIEAEEGVELTNYGEYLERFPPTHQAEIVEDTSWSCSHGIERWRSDCGCSTGAHPGWNQAWRGPLRDALNFLRDSINERIDQQAARVLPDPWAAREDYIDVVLDRSAGQRDRFLSKHGQQNLSSEDRVLVWKWMELSRNAMLMYTSCGWFFDELSGIEAVQVLRYAGRVLQLAKELTGLDLEGAFLARLAEAKSNLAEKRNGREIYEGSVCPAVVDLVDVGAHVAISSLFSTYEQETSIFCYQVWMDEAAHHSAGRAQLAAGDLEVQSRVTRQRERFHYGVLHLGDHNLVAGVLPVAENGNPQAFLDEAAAEFERADFPEVIRVLDQFYGERRYSLRSLFRDEQAKIVAEILAPALEEAERGYTRILEANAALMRYLSELEIEPPEAFQLAAAYVYDSQLQELFSAAEIDVERARQLLTEADGQGTTLDEVSLRFEVEQAIDRYAEAFAADPRSTTGVQALADLVDLAVDLPFGVNLWGAQNRVYRQIDTVYAELQKQLNADQEPVEPWLQAFERLAAKLSLHLSPEGAA
ncbi:MAG: DUF3536 domain-containing protein [Anaerolineales bacterium]